MLSAIRKNRSFTDSKWVHTFPTYAFKIDFRIPFAIMANALIDQSLVRGLRDRLYEKRKLAAIDLEKYGPEIDGS